MATRLQELQYNAIEALNAIVECRGVSFDDRRHALELALAHLQARIEQTQPVKPLYYSLGDTGTDPVDAEMAALLGL